MVFIINSIYMLTLIQYLNNHIRPYISLRQIHPTLKKKNFLLVYKLVNIPWTKLFLYLDWLHLIDKTLSEFDVVSMKILPLLGLGYIRPWTDIPNNHCVYIKLLLIAQLISVFVDSEDDEFEVQYASISKRPILGYTSREFVKCGKPHHHYTYPGGPKTHFLTSKLINWSFDPPYTSHPRLAECEKKNILELWFK